MASRPDGGMYGIKLILPAHLDIPHFVEDYDGADGRRTLMNFPDGPRGETIAADLEINHIAVLEFFKSTQKIPILGTETLFVNYES